MFELELEEIDNRDDLAPCEGVVWSCGLSAGVWLAVFLFYVWASN